jgi:hypothetical protein
MQAKSKLIILKSAEILTYLESHSLVAAGSLPVPSSVSPETLVPICDDFLAKKISGADLEEIARLLLSHPAHDGFNSEWTPESDYDERVERVLVEWLAPEVDCPLTPENVRLLRSFLLGAEWQPMRPQRI